jgi:hypothetical protein
MTEPPTYETDEVLAAIDDQDLAALVNAAFAMEVSLAHNHAQGKGAPSPHPDADARK